ncbi:hypothetical protein [Rhizobium gallicum]|uniref:hypothetical protein n=1 Tax=Rhizobium gallicum TaxID=56730 RepID=UPI000B16685C|nr:hypothetical protein [Rhizobium gallicum]
MNWPGGSHRTETLPRIAADIAFVAACIISSGLVNIHPPVATNEERTPGQKDASNQGHDDDSENEPRRKAKSLKLDSFRIGTIDQ